MQTLDVVERQVLVDYPADPNFEWHHRLLLCSLGGGKWIVSTPTQSIQQLDLAGHRIIILSRNSVFPAAYANNAFAFDPADITAPVLQRLRSEAAGMAEVLGAVPAAAAAAAATNGDVWRISDTSSKDFGEIVPDAAVSNNAIFDRKGDIAMVQLNGVWVHAALEVPQKPGLDAFRARYHAGPGRDPRILGSFTDAAGRRCLSLDVAIPLLLAFVWGHWPVDGPRCVKDFVERMRTAGYLGFFAYHCDWVRNSGVGDKSAVCREHRLLLELLRLMLEVDQLDVSSLVSAEVLVRRIFQIEIAVERNAKSPDFSGLDAIIESVSRSSGGVEIPALSKWFSEHQQKQAFTLKQFRLADEERKEIEKKNAQK